MGGNYQPLFSLPIVANPKQMPPAIFAKFSGGTLAFVNEGDPTGIDSALISIPFTSNPSTKLTYPLALSFLKSQCRSEHVRGSLIMPGGATAEPETLAEDILKISALSALR